MARAQPSEPHAVHHWLAWACERLEAAQVASPAADARLLACEVLQVSPAQLPGAHFDAEQRQRFTQWVEQRCCRVPLQHLTGKAFFRYLCLQVGPGVFIPRPETELVAGCAIEYAEQVAATGRSPLVVDLATGSAAIALAVATEVPSAQVMAVEVDPLALAWAQRNISTISAAQPGGADQPLVQLHAGDLATALPQLEGQVDVVVSNPPYIPLDAQVREPEVAQHDPPLALWSGYDGLDAIRAVQVRSSALLRPGGWVVVEHADCQGRSAEEVFSRSGLWRQVRDHEDLTDRPRFLTARRSG